MIRPPRRRLLLAGGLAGLAEAVLAGPQASDREDGKAAAQTRAQAASADLWTPAVAGTPLVFPRDHGAHPGYRTEWWYLTGWLTDPGQAPLGIQVTFFRTRTRHDGANPSRFAPTQLLFAHAAMASPRVGRLTHAQRSARPGFGLAGFAEDDLDVSIGDWRLHRQADDRIAAQIKASTFEMTLLFTPPGPPVPQGEAGFSRKGPLATQASWYYSRPQLAVSGRLSGPGSQPDRAVSGRAWLDHEWSSEILDPSASGWDWVGLNFDDGSALMAFRIRHREGGVLWSDARWIPGARSTPTFKVLREWRSPRTGTPWPVAMRLAVGERILDLEPLLDDQEIDASASTGTVYWEGAVRVLEKGRQVGAGYLELTGYAGGVTF